MKSQTVVRSPLKAASSLEGVIFDFDGVIADTEELHFRSWNNEAARMQVKLEVSTFAQVMGVEVSDEVAVEKLLGLGYVDRSRKIAERARRYRALQAAQVQPVAGVVNLISDLRARGILIGLATSSTRDRVVEMLRRFGILDHFQSICTREDVSFPKPSPDIYRVAQSSLGRHPSGIVAVEDTSAGVRAAIASGIACLGFRPRLSAAHDFMGCISVIESFGGVSTSSLMRVFEEAKQVQRQLPERRNGSHHS